MIPLVNPPNLPFTFPKWKGDVFEDDFTDVPLGSEPGKEWIDFGSGAVFATSADGLYVKTSVNNVTRVVDFLSSNVYLETEINFYNSGGANNGIVFRQSSSANFHKLITVNNIVYVQMVIGGSATTLLQINEAVNFTGRHIVGVELRGPLIRAYLDGALLASTNSTYNLTATKHGLSSSSGSGMKWKWFRGVRL